MKKILFALCILFSAPVFGQKFMSNSDFEALKKKTLIVILEEPREKLAGKLTPEEAQQYRADIELYNATVKETAEAYLSPIVTVAFKTRTETDALIKKSDPAFAYLQSSTVGHMYATKMGLKMIAKHKDTRQTRNLGDVLTRIAFFSGFEIYFTQDGDMANARHQQFLFEPGVSKATITYGIRQLASALTDISQGKSLRDRDVASVNESKLLASKKLLISKLDLDPKVTPDVLKSAYPFPMEIVEEAQFQNAIASKEAGTAVLVVLPAMTTSEKFVFKFEVYDCESAKTLAPSIPGGAKGWSVSAQSSMIESIKKDLNEKVPYVELINIIEIARLAGSSN
jgi:hypothetical protein